MKRILPLACLALCGCWTFNETPFPTVAVTEAPANTNIMVAVTGFAAALSETAWISGYRTVYVPGGRCHPGYCETIPSQVSYTQMRGTDIFLRRALDAFETAGYSIGASVPDWTVDVEFSGPYVTNGETAKTVAWQVLTLFLCDYSAVEWTARLKVRDNRTGRLAFHREYRQRYETNVFGLIPLFGISACGETSYNHMTSWCLSALTDQAVADAAAYLGGKR